MGNHSVSQCIAHELMTCQMPLSCLLIRQLCSSEQLFVAQKLLHKLSVACCTD